MEFFNSLYDDAAPKNDGVPALSQEKLYSTEETAKILGVSPDTLYCWKCNGVKPPIVDPVLKLELRG